MIGLDFAGKSSILYKVQLDHVTDTFPTLGVNHETINHKRCNLEVWDIGGHHTIRHRWQQLFHGTDAVVFVVDSCDKRRLGEARAELHKIVAHQQLQDVPILVFANKQESDHALPPSAVACALDLHSITSHTWHLQGCSGVTGDGIHEGLDSLISAITTEKRAAVSSHNAWHASASVQSQHSATVALVSAPPKQDLVCTDAQPLI